jgi:DNA polymerase IV
VASASAAFMPSVRKWTSSIPAGASRREASARSRVRGVPQADPTKTRAPGRTSATAASGETVRDRQVALSVSTATDDTASLIAPGRQNRATSMAASAGVRDYRTGVRSRMMVHPMRTILHADLDAFYASVEVLDEPSLRGKPVIVGGRKGERGVVMAASYEARAFGVGSAMPLRTAAARCPHGVFLPGRPERYRELSERVMAIFASYTPLVEPISLDEAFLDVSASAAAFGDGETIAREIKRRVLDEVGLVVSVGVATNKLCAKVASDLRKPDALVVVPPGGEATFLAPLPIRRLWGVGPQAQAALAEYGVVTIGQLAALPAGTLHRRFGRHGDDLSARARGVDVAGVHPTHQPKSIGHEHTFGTDTRDRARLDATLLDLAESVGSRLRRHDLAARAVQLKLRYEGFETLTRQAPLPRQTRESEPLYDTARSLLHRTLVDGRAVRLIGLTAISLTDAQQLTLFDDGDRQDRLARSIDVVRDRFGEGSITRARLLRERPVRRFDFGERPEGPAQSDDVEPTAQRDPTDEPA